MKQIESIDLWYKLMMSARTFDQEIIEKIYNSLQSEYPMISTVMLEQTCNLNCVHCFFKPEKSSKTTSYEINLIEKLETIIPQLPKNASVVDGGRILREWHIPLLEKLRLLRNDINIGMVDNGTYLKLSNHLQKSSFRFDCIDISIDGTEEFHNLQRQSTDAYAIAIEGLRKARNFVTPRNKRGTVTSLFSASKINYHSLAEAAEYLFKEQLVDEFHITPVSPVFRNTHVIMELDEFKIYWDQVKKVFALGEKYGVKVFTRMYQISDMKLLAETVGTDNIINSFKNVHSISVSRGCIRFIVDDVPIIYVPLSICPSETFLINPDGYYRLAYSIQFTLDELHKGISADGENTIPYTVEQITKSSSFKKLYKQGAKQWETNFGMQYLRQEYDFFKAFN